MFRMGLILLLTILVVPMVDASQLGDIGSIELVGLMVKEGLIGAVLGFIVSLFIYMLNFAGDIIDTSIGLAMAKVMNPATDIQSGAVGSIFSYIFVLLFFASNSHLVLIRAFVYTFECIPLHALVSIDSIYACVVSSFLSAFNLSIHLLLPYIACEMILEITLGILMKMIPQIHVFVINIQLKIILGIVLLLALIQPVGNVMTTYIDTSMKELQKAIVSIAVSE